MKPLITFPADPYAPLALYFTRDGRHLYSGGVGKVLRRWAVSTWEMEVEIHAHDNSVNTCAVTPDESVLITGSTDSTVKVWSLPNLTLLHTLTDRKKTVSTVTISRGGNYLVASYYGGRVAIWEPNGTPVLAFKANDKNLVNAQLSPDNRLLATGGLTDVISIWSFPDGNAITTLKGHQTAAFPIVFLNEGRTLLTQGYEGTLREWDTRTWECTAVRQSPVNPVRSMTFSPDHSLVALATQGKVLVFDELDKTPIHTLDVGTPATGGVAFSHDNRYLAVGAADRNLRIWELP